MVEANQMQVRKPDAKTVYVTATDKRTGKSKAITIYNATAEQVINILRQTIAGSDGARTSQSTVPVA